MNNQHVKSKVNEVKGKVKQNVGHATGNERLESEGVFDQVKGKVQKGFGDLKDKIKEKVDSVLDSNKSKH